MALLDRKIPILTGINDTPSTTGQPKHPNASLLCKQYNDLIDNELTQLNNRLLPKATEQLVSSYYVDATTGNDSTGDGTNTAPFATIQKAIDVIAGGGYATNWVTIYCSGTFTDPTLDFSQFDSRKFDLWWNGNPYIQILGDTNFVIDITTKYNTLFTFNPFYKQAVYLGFCTINSTQPLILKDYDNFIYLSNIAFNATATNNTAIVYIDNCKQVVIDGCAFTKESGSTIGRAINVGGHSQLFIQGSYFTDLGCPALTLSEGSRVDNDYQPLTITGSTIKVEVNNATFATSQTGFARSDFTIGNGGLVIANGQLFTSTAQPVIDDAVSGTELDTINAILTALREWGITKV